MDNPQKIFPFELIQNSVESLHSKHHTTSKIIYLTTIGITILCIGLLPVIKVNLSSQSRGVIRSKRNNNALTTSFYGQIKAINIQENQKVEQGDTLLILNTAKLDTQTKHNQSLLNQHRAYLKDLTLLINSKNANPQLYTSLFNQEYLQYQQGLNEYQLSENFKRKEFRLAEKLLASGSIAKVEFEQKKFEWEIARNALKSYCEQQIKIWEVELQKQNDQINALKSENLQLAREREQYIIVAPISGTIVQYSGVTAGNFVAPNQPFAEISSNEHLIVESYVSPADIGLIHTDMEVKFQIDAFNYNQWGLAQGKVIDISSDIMITQNQPHFIVKCALNSTQLSLKNGHTGNFKKGMTLTARYAITERTLFQLLYDKMDDWLNPNLG